MQCAAPFRSKSRARLQEGRRSRMGKPCLIVSMRDVINALISWPFCGSFSVIGMHQTDAGLEVRALLPMPPEMYGLLNRKPGAKSAANSNASTHADSLAAYCRAEKSFSLPAGRHRHGQQNLIDDPIALVRCCRILMSGAAVRRHSYGLMKRWGAHADTMDASTGTRFPSGRRTPVRVSVVGQFNYWDGRRHPMRSAQGSPASGAVCAWRA